MSLNLNKLFPYDIETFPNVFTVCIANAGTRKLRVYEISNRVDQREQLFEHLRHIYKYKGRMVGFNNEGFDYPVIHYLLSNKNCTVEDLYTEAMKMLFSENKFGNAVPIDQRFIPQIDLYKIHHFDNKARMTSLKMLEFNMRSKTIEDLPFKPGTILTDTQIDVLLKYNKKDVIETTKFLEESLDQIAFRDDLSLKFGKDFTNFNDTKIGKEYFVLELEKSGISCYTKGKFKKPIQTKRKSIDLKECIFDYIKFERPEFQAVKNWFISQTITETKGVLTDILESDLGDVAKYSEMVTKRKKLTKEPSDEVKKKWLLDYPLCWFEEKELKSKKISYYVCWKVATCLNVVIDGLRYDYGTGGIHASIESQIVRSDDSIVLRDEDVSSYYPNLAIKNNIYPEHFGKKFCDIYKSLYDMRVDVKRQMKVAKSKGDDVEYKRLDCLQQMLKLALNGTYGASNDQYSPFYDPKFTMMITINGQLSLCMLAEKLLEIEGLSIVQCNTDGLTYSVDKSRYDESNEVCKWWQKVTKLELEGVNYEMMAIRDVNNYVCVDTTGKVKYKGAYVYKDLGWHQNQSALVIPKAATEYFINGVPIETTIYNHDNYLDFMLRTKVPRSSKLVGVTEGGDEISLQNISRYYITDKGVELVKIMPPIEKTFITNKYINDDGDIQYAVKAVDIKRLIKKGYSFVEEVELESPDRRMGINIGCKVEVCNDLDDFTDNIDYNYYINEAYKLINFSISEDSESNN